MMRFARGSMESYRRFYAMRTDKSAGEAGPLQLGNWIKGPGPVKKGQSKEMQEGDALEHLNSH